MAVIAADAKDFNEVVIDNDKDTLIEFYSPWCGRCRDLVATYNQLAEKLKNEDVAIVRLDATANDFPATFKFSRFPALFWLPKDAKDKPVAYKEGLGVNDFLKYIARNATTELKGYDRSGKAKKTVL